MFKTLKKRFCKTLAFTLAETLIVMGIIGVVAALTIPNLNSSTADKEKVAKLKKVYSNINDAIGRTEAVYGSLSDNFPSYNTYADRLGDFLKVSKTCGTSTNQGCLSKEYKYLNGTAYTGHEAHGGNDTASNVYKYILADGTGLGIAASTGIYYFVVDIDGPTKGSSTLGKDLFELYIIRPDSTYSALASEKKGILLSDIPASNSSNTMLLDKTDLTENFKSGRGLATWVIQNDNMDYLKTTDGKCKNNVVLSWTNTSCK